MKLFHQFTTSSDAPGIFPSPLNVQSHPIAMDAARDLQARLMRSSTGMDSAGFYGVLVVHNSKGEFVYLAAHAFEEQIMVPDVMFVPSLIADVDRQQLKQDLSARISALRKQILAIGSRYKLQQKIQELKSLEVEQENELALLRTKHTENKSRRHDARKGKLSDEQKAFLAKQSQNDKREWQAIRKKWHELVESASSSLQHVNDLLEPLHSELHSLIDSAQKELANHIQVSNATGEQRSVCALFNGSPMPEGTGDCASIRLLNYALIHKLTPVAMTEFWWGESPSDEVRHHGQSYPACNGRCAKILPFMLEGVRVEDKIIDSLKVVPAEEPILVYEDDVLAVFNKPHGLLSVPGKSIQDSVLTRLQVRYPQASGPLLLHRLDLATSGLILMAKNSVVHKTLQKQFLNRTIKKEYIALLDGDIHQDSGVLSLPLTTDFYDRPRQRVCYDTGKEAITEWQKLEWDGRYTRVRFQPLTGRTHQLRMHAAHAAGLNAPIVGDRLYGKPAARMMLHARMLRFQHPVTGKTIELVAPTPF